MEGISVVVNVLNEADKLPYFVSSLKGVCEEIVVVDMESQDGSAKVAESLGAKVFTHKKVDWVEPARNYAISKAKGKWILVLDLDEEVPLSLVRKLKAIVKNPKADYYSIPRKNIIFGKWIRHSRWWPDYNIRFFKKGKVAWSDRIHSIPLTQGVGAEIEDKEEYAIIHNNYQTVEDYLNRMNRYTSVQADLILKEGYRFIWKDLISKPMAEFLGRYFEGEGYKDGLHGLALCLLQAFSEVVLYLKIWQKEKFQPQAITLEESSKEFGKKAKEAGWWMDEAYIRSESSVKSIFRKLKRKIFNKNGF